MKIKARAKINLALDVVGKRADGYHDIRSVMTKVDLADELTIKKVYKENYLKIVTNCSFLPVDSRNIAHKAAMLLIEKYGISTGVFISLEKKIPVSAGLAGGSADAAAVLLGMRKLFGLPISREEMREIGLSLGADVPYCLTGGTCLAEGVGERLVALNSLPKAWVLLAKPPVAVSTREVFEAYSSAPGGQKPDIDALLHSIKSRDLAGICKEMRNSLESVTAAKHPDIGRLKEIMLGAGAPGAVMSGSGPTVFGVFENRGQALEARAAVWREMCHVKEIFVRRMF